MHVANLIGRLRLLLAKGRNVVVIEHAVCNCRIFVCIARCRDRCYFGEAGRVGTPVNVVGCYFIGVAYFPRESDGPFCAAA